ncbi:hypothetical protein SmJEL517_g00895 [Synchytrium microbalum]|uniref:Alpha-methylacyl-CoA racemase n=1 Tax=Synchytrium microbalum TaxID=1806994 RepID=A0A507CHS5_9FUNG|nr:uncharacterized protein SmJEL517_g00895 [Synchytrium microbalum]TPX37163.1 hypothetical protein SmJEL517_g00895 [Synchytrium microbalum]
MDSPLGGIKVIELAGLAPAPFAGMILADWGANVVRVDRAPLTGSRDLLARGKRSMALDLKSPKAIAAVRRMVKTADVFIEPFRPGVAEKLGLGPDVLLKDNPRLIYARMTGFGQTGAYKNMAGHDINYIAVSGALAAIGRKGDNPMFPLNILGDFAGGGMLCAMGILLSLLERSKSGKGQVVDAAMVDGAAYLASAYFKTKNAGGWPNPRGENMLDSGAPFYDVYKTKDGKFMSVGAIEPQFFALLLKGLELDPTWSARQMDQKEWPELKLLIASRFIAKNRSEWEKIFDLTDACVAPVLEAEEVNGHIHNNPRKTFIPDMGPGKGFEVPPVPRLSRTPGVVKSPNPIMGANTKDVLKEYGFSDAEVADLISSKVAVAKL